jgi:choline dehydrogenase-like flavoprotein
MIEDARALPAGEPIRAKTCVIGAGIAGILLALELEQLGHDVLLLEAGNRRRDPAQRAAQAGLIEGDQHEPIEDVATRRLGGAMALWGGRLLPLDASDFAPHATRKLAWPFGLGELEPWYRMANERLSAGAYEYDAALCLPHETPLFAQLRDAQIISEQKTWRWCPPLRFSHFSKQLRESKRVRVLYNALIGELSLDASSTRVQGAVLHSAPGQTRKVYADTFVLSGGGLETARLLLASRGLGGPHVGKHYLTHPVSEVGVLHVDPMQAARLCSFETSHDGVYVRRLLSLSERARSERSLLNLNVTFWSPDPHDPAHGSGILSAYALTKRLLIANRLTDKVAGAHRSNLGRDAAVLRHLSNILGTMPETMRTLTSWSRKRWLQQRSIPALIHPGNAGRVRLRFDAEQSDDDHNCATLSDQRDAFGMPRLKVRYVVSARDRQSYHASLSLLASELARVRAGKLELPSREQFVHELALGDGTHQMGLTRMSANAREGVVDAQCRLHDAPNVYVASSAVFPTAGAAPPTLTLAALALRLAHHLDRQLRTT